MMNSENDRPTRHHPTYYEGQYQSSDSEVKITFADAVGPILLIPATFFCLFADPALFALEASVGLAYIGVRVARYYTGKNI